MPMAGGLLLKEEHLICKYEIIIECDTSILGDMDHQPRHTSVMIIV